MTNTLTTVFEKVNSGLGQGSVLDQIDKLFRKQQRINLFEKLEKIDKKDIENFPVVLYKHHTKPEKTTGLIALFPAYLERSR